MTKNNNLTSFLKSSFSELGYITVHSCPKSPGEWNDSSLRLNCNDTHKYHCAPYLSETSQLYEFCYRSLNISKGKWYKSFNPICLPKMFKFCKINQNIICFYQLLSAFISIQFVVTKSVYAFTIKQNFKILNCKVVKENIQKIIIS